MIVIHSNFYLRCIVSEITMLYWKPNMTSSWFCHQGAFQANFHDELCKSDHDFPIQFQSNFLSAMHGLRDNEVLLLTGYDVIVSFPPGGALGDFFMTNHVRANMTSRKRSIVTFCLGCMVSEITMFYDKPNMTTSWFLRQGALHAICLNGFWKIDHDLLIAFHCNFFSGMHGFRDNEVLLQTGYEVIVISPLGDVSGDFS